MCFVCRKQTPTVSTVDSPIIRNTPAHIRNDSMPAVKAKARPDAKILKRILAMSQHTRIKIRIVRRTANEQTNDLSNQYGIAHLQPPPVIPNILSNVCVCASLRIHIAFLFFEQSVSSYIIRCCVCTCFVIIFYHSTMRQHGLIICCNN